MITQKEELLSTINEVISTQIGEVISGLKEEVDDHREAINEGNNEIQSNFEVLAELDSKINKLSDRLDEIFMLVKGEKTRKSWDIKPLTKKEKDVFMALYELCEIENNYVTYKKLASRLKLTESLVCSYITNFIAKGIPVAKYYQNRIINLSLDDNFRQEQAKKNLVGINTLLTYWLPRS